MSNIKSPMDGAAVLLTGASGFLGGAIASKLQTIGASVHVILRNKNANLNFRPSNVFDLSPDLSDIPGIFNEVRPDFVIHTAALSRVQENDRGVLELILSNMSLTAALAYQASVSGVKGFVNAGTSWQNSRGVEYSPFNFYAVTKEAAMLSLDYFSRERYPAATLKIFDTYGPLDTRGKIVDLILNAGLSGSVLKMSPGNQRIDLSHINDVASAFIHAAELLGDKGLNGHSAYAVYGERLTLRDLTDQIERAAGVSVNVEWGGRPYREGEIMEPCSQIPPLPGYRHQTELEAGLKSLMNVAYL